MPESRRENYLKDHPGCPPKTGPGLRPESRRENYPHDRPCCPPTTDPGLMPEARRENYLNDHKLSSDNRQWINTRCTTGKISTFCQLQPPQSNQHEDLF